MRAEITYDCAGEGSHTAVHASGERTGDVRQNDGDRGDRRPVGLVEMKHHRGEHGQDARKRRAECGGGDGAGEREFAEFPLQVLSQAKRVARDAQFGPQKKISTRASAPINSGTSGWGSNTRVTCSRRDRRIQSVVGAT